jgi:hypothetical protein
VGAPPATVNVTLCHESQLVKVSVASDAMIGPEGAINTIVGAPFAGPHPSLPVSWILHAIDTLLPGAAVTTPDESTTLF